MIRKGIVFLMFISTQDVDEGAAHVLLISHAETFTFPQPNIDLQKWWLGNYFPLWEGLFSGAMLVLERLLLFGKVREFFSIISFWVSSGCSDCPPSSQISSICSAF